MSNSYAPSRPAPAFQNAELAKLSRQTYDLATLEAVRQSLVSHGTLSLRRYSSGGSSAVTVLDLDRTLESAIDGLLINQWDRDAIMQALAELAVALDAPLGAGLGIKPDAWKEGLRSCLVHHVNHQHRFLDIISGRVSGFEMGRRPHIRYNPLNLGESTESWGHGQNDSLGFISYLLFFALNRGYLTWSEVEQLANPFACLQHHYFWTVHVWEDWELGAWEDKRAEHASSIAVVAASLREQLEFVRKHGRLVYCTEGKCYDVTEAGVADMLSRCESKLRELLPNEFIRSDNGEVRTVDSAIVNALLQAALSGKPLVDDGMTMQVISNIEQNLMGHIGISRYPRDVWDGRVNRRDLGNREEAQWCHVSPMLSYVLGEMYRRTGKQEHLDHQVYHFNRSLAHVNERWRIPEAYIVDATTRQWVSDANEPLAWAQAMTLLAIAGMKASLTHRDAVAAASIKQASHSPSA
ncbi:MAG TPA: glycoside hydrolase family 15 protein [Candidatus Obscuribacterales bacterium]